MFKAIYSVEQKSKAFFSPSEANNRSRIYFNHSNFPPRNLAWEKNSIEFFSSDAFEAALGFDKKYSKFTKSKFKKRGKNQFMSKGDLQIKFTCRPLGRQWGRATGPLETERCSTPSFKFRPCTPVRIHGIRSERLPYGFGIYARELFPSGMPCSQRFCQPADTCKKYFYPCLPTKPAKIYSSYTFSQRGAPYTCPNCPPATCCSAQLVWALCYCEIKFNEALEVTNVLCFSHDGEDSPRSESRKHQIKPR